MKLGPFEATESEVELVLRFLLVLAWLVFVAVLFA
jgi:hypothetical protein